MSYGSEAAAINALLSIFAGFWLVILAFFVLNIVAGWKIFEKAGQPGWASIVPFYNSYIRYKIFWGNGWLFFGPSSALCSAASRYSARCWSSSASSSTS